MPTPASYDDVPEQIRRFRFLPRCGIGIMLLLSLLSWVQLIDRPGTIEALSAAADTTLLLFLIGLHILLGRVRLATAALAIGAAILVYSILNILFFPTALLRVSSQPLLAVAITVAYVDSRR